jgi:tetratricopeptide (TPR) repeat protein
VLYLEIGYFIEAERCFLMAFNIKRSEGDKKDKKSQIPLLQTFCHLFDCNLKLKNLIQCEQILGNISSILDETEGSVDILHRLRYYIRSGKLLFFEGKLDLAENYYHHALNLLKKHNLSIQEHA